MCYYYYYYSYYYYYTTTTTTTTIITTTTPILLLLLLLQFIITPSFPIKNIEYIAKQETCARSHPFAYQYNKYSGDMTIATEAAPRTCIIGAEGIDWWRQCHTLTQSPRHTQPSAVSALSCSFSPLSPAITQIAGKPTHHQLLDKPDSPTFRSDSPPQLAIQFTDDFPRTTAAFIPSEISICTVWCGDCMIRNINSETLSSVSRGGKKSEFCHFTFRCRGEKSEFCNRTFRVEWKKKASFVT